MAGIFAAFLMRGGDHGDKRGEWGPYDACLRQDVETSNNFLLFIGCLFFLLNFTEPLKAQELSSAGSSGVEGEQRPELNFDLFDEPSMHSLGRFVPGPYPSSTLVDDPHNKQPVFEVFSGVDATENTVGFYTGGVSAMFASLVSLEGFRLRAVGGKSWYRYHARASNEVDSPEVEFVGQSFFYEAMVGYEFRFQGSIFKVYGGALSVVHDIDPRDVNNALQGQEVGGKALLEVWREFDGGAWFSGYGSYATARDTYVGHGRLGMALFSFSGIDVEGGVEFGAFGDEEFDALRLGGFSRFKFSGAEVTVSGGVSGNYERPNSVYISAQYFTKLYRSDFFY